MLQKAPTLPGEEKHVCLKNVQSINVWIQMPLTLTVPVTTIDALRHFKTG